MKRNLIMIWMLVLCFLVPAAVRADELDPYLMPWESPDIGAEAREAGELRFYFMSSEGYRMISTDDEPDKWGDCCLVVFPNGEVMLIDAAMPDYAPILIRNLERLGVKKIDYLLISHPHEDHAGGLYAPGGGIPAHFEIGRMFYNGTYNGKWSEPDRLETLIDSYGIPREVVTEGWTMDIGDVHLRVISPSADLVGVVLDTTEKVNNASVLLRMDYGDFSALFTGDIYLRMENELIRDKAELLDVDLLKMPHHGEVTSNTRDFAKAVSPKLAVATGHIFVQDYIYRSYTKTGAKVRFDMLDGYIRVWSDGVTMEWDQSRERETDHFDRFEYVAKP